MENRSHIAARLFTLMISALLLVSGVYAPVSKLKAATYAVEQGSEQDSSSSESEQQIPEASISQWDAISSIPSAIRFIPMVVTSDHLPFFLLRLSFPAEFTSLQEAAVVSIFPSLLEIFQTTFQYIIAPNAP